MYADIALMELETAVQFSDNIRPACLHQVFNSVPETAWVCGWGATEFGKNTTFFLEFLTRRSNSFRLKRFIKSLHIETDFIAIFYRYFNVGVFKII